MLENNQRIYKFDLRTYEWNFVTIKIKVNSNNNNKDKYKLNLGIDSHVSCVYNDNMYVFGGYNAELGLYSNSLIKVNL